MNKIIMIGLVLLLGIISGTSISPLLAQSQTGGSEQVNCYVGEGSNAACSGKWIIFAGNASNLVQEWKETPASRVPEIGRPNRI